MSDQPLEYEDRNYRAVNEYVDGLGRYVNENIRSRRASTFIIYAKYLSMLLLAAGVAGLLILWGLSFLKDPKIVEKTKIVEKPVSYKPEINITLPDESRTIKRDAQKKINELSEDSDEKSSIYNYVIFRNIPFTSDGFQHVTVGMQFDSEEDKMPSSQWCYISRRAGKLNNGELNVYLARKEKSIYSTETLSKDHSDALNTSLSTLKSAQKVCHFE